MIHGMRGLAVLLVIALLSASTSPAWALRVEKYFAPAAPGATMEVVAEEALVRFDPAVPLGTREAALRSVGARLLQELPLPDVLHVALPPGLPVVSGLALVKALPGVLDASPNVAYRPLKTPNDPQVPNQYHFGAVNAFAAWEYEVGTSSTVTVAVMDTGVEGTHPDLSAKFSGLISQNCTAGACVAEAGGTAIAACNHGTRVAGVAAASTDNGTGVAGISWGAKLLSLRIFSTTDCLSDCANNGVNACVTSAARIINALDHARGLQNSAATGRIVVNMSIGASGACPTGVGSLQEAVTTAFNAGLVMVASAGNDGSAVNNPANCAGVIPVGATDSANNVANFSSRGTELATDGLVAPGVNIVTTDINGGITGNATGTSFSSPLVAGLAALVLASRPTKTPTEVKDILRGSASNIGVSSLALGEGVHPMGSVAGAGIANAFSAMRLTITGSAEFDGTQKAIAFPNPFRPAVNGNVTLTIPTNIQGAGTTIKIYTAGGRLVRDLKGQSWDGRNNDGLPVATGTYLFLIDTDRGKTTGRVAVIR